MKITKRIVYFLSIAAVIFACRESGDIGQKTSSGETGAVKVVSGSKAITVRTDSESINEGKVLFGQKCRFCHDAYSTETLTGPGLYEILKKPKLPVSKKPATPENIINQLKDPFRLMPAFTDLSEEDILNIIAFLNTL